MIWYLIIFKYIYHIYKLHSLFCSPSNDEDGRTRKWFKRYISLHSSLISLFAFTNTFVTLFVMCSNHVRSMHQPIYRQHAKLLTLRFSIVCAVGTCLTPTSATNRKLITAFHNLAQDEPNHHLINYNEPYFVVNKLYPSQIVDDRAIPVIFFSAVIQ